MVLIVPLWNWNNCEVGEKRMILGFNRTFMELKYIKHVKYEMLKCVLIVPLWNWNLITRKADAQTVVGFNRTFMELKFYCII